MIPAKKGHVHLEFHDTPKEGYTRIEGNREDVAVAWMRLTSEVSKTLQISEAALCAAFVTASPLVEIMNRISEDSRMEFQIPVKKEDA